MRIIVLTSRHHLYADFILRSLFARFESSIVLIVEQEAIIPGRNRWFGLWSYLKTAGWYYTVTQVIKQIAVNHWYTFFSIPASTRVLGWEELAEHGELEATLAAARADIIISIFSKYILNSRQLLLARLGALNVHPSLLPAYRGVSPVFWTLANGEKETGVTVHTMTSRIDTGSIIAQRDVPILPTDTEHALYLRCARVAATLLPDAIEKFIQGKITAPSHQTTSYYSLPTHQAVNQFRRKGRRFFQWKELLALRQMPAEAI